MLQEPAKNKVKVTITQSDNSVLYQKEFEKEFHQEGMITV
jgi:hypothetical protein